MDPVWESAWEEMKYQSILMSRKKEQLAARAIRSSIYGWKKSDW
jgi:hypothetical protein